MDRQIIGNFFGKKFKKRKIFFTLTLVKLNMPVHGIFVNTILSICFAKFAMP
jgi:hypothetical protein